MYISSTYNASPYFSCLSEEKIIHMSDTYYTFLYPEAMLYVLRGFLCGCMLSRMHVLEESTFNLYSFKNTLKVSTLI